ncbi:MAG: isochorismatase family protein [Sandaracinaceae bacterium]|nr:isochorismatase family protein [Sandaracinaceae bacterium]
MNTLRIAPATSSLVIVDVQERLLGAMNAGVAERVVGNLGILATAARRLAVPAFVTEQYPKGLGRTVANVRDAFGETLAMNPPFEKLEFDAMRNAHFARAFTHACPPATRPHVIVAGMEAHICVYQTARGFREQGYSVHVVSDACCSRTEENFRIARGLWERMSAVVSSTETVLFDWLGKAGTEDFKILSRLIK